MSDVYRLFKVADLLLVPIEKRERCVTELLNALALLEIAVGEGIDIEQAKQESAFEWCDDESQDAHLMTADGEPILTLQITKDQP